MPIVSSGEIKLIADIEAEFDQTGTEDISLQQAGTDAGLSGEIRMFQFYDLSDAVAPSVIILTPSSSISSSGFTARGRITSDGGATITARGFYIGTSSTYTNNTQYSAGSGSGDFTYTISGLSSGTTYYIRPYATNSAGTTVGSGTTTATSSPSLSSHISFSQTSGGGSSWETPSSSFSFSASSAWSANSNSYTGYAYTGASNGASHGWSGFYVGGTSTSSYGYQYWTISGNSYNGGTVYGSGRNPTTGGYAGGYISFSKSGYSGFGITCAQRNFSYSDVRLKTNINLVGKSPLGLNIYTWNYINEKHGVGTFKGVMAQEVPNYARTKDKDGFYMVDYNAIDVDFEKI